MSRSPPGKNLSPLIKGGAVTEAEVHKVVYNSIRALHPERSVAQINEDTYQEIAEGYRRMGISTPAYINEHFAQRAKERAKEWSQMLNNN